MTTYNVIEAGNNHETGGTKFQAHMVFIHGPLNIQSVSYFEGTVEIVTNEAVEIEENDGVFTIKQKSN